MAASRIEKPTLFADWLKTKALFDDGATMTETYMTDGHEPGTRYAYGKSAEGWCFYIAMTRAEEHVFWDAYREWINRNQVVDRHMAIVSSTKPPSCGTPDTPLCEGVMGPTALLALKPSAGRGVKAA